MRGSNLYRLTHGLEQRLMHPHVFQDLLQAHKRHPAQYLTIWAWRQGPSDRYTVYDYDYPRRIGIDWRCGDGISEHTWSVWSHVRNIPAVAMEPYADDIKPGYKDAIASVLQEGCVVPGAALDAWMGDDSRKWCVPELRIRYKRPYEYRTGW